MEGVGVLFNCVSSFGYSFSPNFGLLQLLEHLDSTSLEIPYIYRKLKIKGYNIWHVLSILRLQSWAKRCSLTYNSLRFEVKLIQYVFQLVLGGYNLVEKAGAILLYGFYRFWNTVRGTALCGGSDKGVLFISVKDAVMHFRQDDQKQNLSFVFAGWKNPFTTELCF